MITAWVEPDAHGGAYHVVAGFDNEMLCEIIHTYSEYNTAEHHAKQINEAITNPHFRDLHR